MFGKTFKIAFAGGKVSGNPARLVEQRPERNARIRFLSAEEELRLREAIKTRCPHHMPELDLGLNTRMRKGEQYSLEWTQVSFELCWNWLCTSEKLTSPIPRRSASRMMTRSFQAWLRHLQPLSSELGTLAAKTLAEQFDADRSAADWRRFGRTPGFTNRKSQHRNELAFYPFVRLTSHTGLPFSAAARFLPAC